MIVAFLLLSTDLGLPLKALSIDNSFKVLISFDTSQKSHYFWLLAFLTFLRGFLCIFYTSTRSFALSAAFSTSDNLSAWPSSASELWEIWHFSTLQGKKTIWNAAFRITPLSLLAFLPMHSPGWRQRRKERRCSDSKEEHRLCWLGQGLI